MIKSDTAARMECDQEGCEENVRVRLLLMPNGGFIPDIPPHARNWQLLMDPKNACVPYGAKCPVHADKSRIVKSSVLV